ncbi:uncharacterized protein BX663DRAFT_561823 [Cokeromyces recurvatus]|uniref:uncharacterized protein n=1 Tax=Cokeromyces recurvatus TaxID=90255 RepID=UPI002220B74D|nr:uncharacterized protein BX663DRAFT_561823 [Cokeromyces recurvatus]KAI7902268.1 hypothetical protein BX663DRAFT_561823 [Cokeromyces recurvatus]
MNQEQNHNKQQLTNTVTRIGASSSSSSVTQQAKRSRAPIACFRCHHKKVRCDGLYPSCSRCGSTGILCAYPTSRRSRATQHTAVNIDPYINNISNLEDRIRRIESNMESQYNMIQSILHTNNQDTEKEISTKTKTTLLLQEIDSKMSHTEPEIQDSKSILVQLRLHEEQRILKNKRKTVATIDKKLISPKTFNKIKKRQRNHWTDHDVTIPTTTTTTTQDNATYFRDMMTMNQDDINSILFEQQQQQQQPDHIQWNNDPTAFYTSLLPTNSLIQQETTSSSSSSSSSSFMMNHNTNSSRFLNSHIVSSSSSRSLSSNMISSTAISASNISFVKRALTTERPSSTASYDDDNSNRTTADIQDTL